MLGIQTFRRGLGLALVAGGTTFAAGCATISPQQEAQLGAQAAAQANQQLPIVRDAALNQYINQLGNRIAAQGSRNIQWHFYLVNSDVVNAMSLPGGYVYINRGIVEHASNLSELAGVVAHEIGHVEHRDQVQQLERAQQANVGVTLASILLGQPSAIAQAAIGVGGQLYLSHFSREAETNADEAAVGLTTRAGIDPRGLPSFFQKLLQLQQSQPSAIEQWFSTHPTDQQRIQDTEALISQIPQSRLSQLTRDTQAFEQFKARFAQYPQPPAQYRAQ